MDFPFFGRKIKTAEKAVYFSAENEKEYPFLAEKEK